VVLSDSEDKKTRYIELHVPITEGRRYRVGDVQFEGNTVVKTEFLKPLFGLKAGEYYDETLVRKGLEKSREVYGGVGYAEFTGFPDYMFHDDPPPGAEEIPQVLAAPPESLPAVVDVTVRLQEGKQYFVNRITFVGNSTTHDSVIRRNMNLLEGSVFDTSALKNSLRRINQLGYFKPLEEGKGVDLTFDRGDHATVSSSEPSREH
jgi:outer membrane protein insertion porin family